MIVQQGSINTTALTVPALYIQIVPPQNIVINGVPSNVIGLVGSASWGPVDVPVGFGSYPEYVANFGGLVARKYDMGTHVATAVLQGAQAFSGVRVTDGSDTAAMGYYLGSAVTSVSITSGGSGATPGTYSLTFTGGGGTGAAGTATVGSNGSVQSVDLTDGGTGYTSTPTVGLGGTPGGEFIELAAGLNVLTLTAINTGSTGNGIVVTMGYNAFGNVNVTVTCPGFQPELFSNLVQPEGSAIWPVIVNAINNGINTFTGPSQLVVASQPGSVGGITTTPVTLSGGTDGASGVSATQLLGTDGTSRTGMYALRGQGCAIGVLCDCDTSSAWSVQTAFGLSEGVYMIGVGPSGDTISDALTVFTESGATGYSFKLMFGDWIWWVDTVNQVTRLVSPQGFVAGRLGNLSPQNSSLNKQLYGVAGTQKTGLGGDGTYSYDDLQILFGANIDVISSPSPGGAYFSCLLGHNTSSNPGTWNDAYTRMTNYIAATLNGGMGVYVGDVINSGLFLQIRSTLLSFLQNLLSQGLLGSLDGSLPFGVVCDTTNNPLSRTSLGYVQADCQVQYQGINEKFIVNIEGGQTVIVTMNSAAPTGT